MKITTQLHTVATTYHDLKFKIIEFDIAQPQLEFISFQITITGLVNIVLTWIVSKPIYH